MTKPVRRTGGPGKVTKPGKKLPASIANNLPNTQPKENGRTGSGHAERDNKRREAFDEQKRREQRKARFGNNMQAGAQSQPDGPTHKTAKLVPLADRITHVAAVHETRHLHSVGLGSRKRTRSEEPGFEERKRSRPSPFENTQPEPAKKDGKTMVNDDKHQKRTIKQARGKHHNNNYTSTPDESHKHSRNDTVTQNPPVVKETGALSASAIPIQAEQETSEKPLTSIKAHEPKGEPKSTDLVHESKSSNQKSPQVEQSVNTVTVEQTKTQIITKTSDTKVSGSSINTTNTPARKRRIEEEEESSEEHERKKHRANSYSTSATTPEQTIKGQVNFEQAKDEHSEQEHLKTLLLQTSQKDKNTTPLPTLAHNASAQKPHVKPASSFASTNFAPVALNQETDHEFAEYDDDSVPIMHSTLIKHDDSEYLSNYPSIELKQEALALIERGFKSHDFGRPSGPKEGPTKVIDDCDLYLRGGKIHVATEHGTILAADYLKLVGIPETKRVRFSGVKPAWAKASIANRFARRVDVTSYWVPGPYPSAWLGPNVLEIVLGSVIEVFELDEYTGYGWGKRLDTGKVGWFLYDHTVGLMDAYPLLDWTGLFTEEDLAPESSAPKESSTPTEMPVSEYMGPPMWPTSAAASLAHQQVRRPPSSGPINVVIPDLSKITESTPAPPGSVAALTLEARNRAKTGAEQLRKAQLNKWMRKPANESTSQLADISTKESAKTVIHEIASIDVIKQTTVVTKDTAENADLQTKTESKASSSIACTKSEDTKADEHVLEKKDLPFFLPNKDINRKRAKLEDLPEDEVDWSDDEL